MKINKTILAGLLLIPALSFSQVWNQVGADIDGDANDASGNSVSLSADGSIVAIGATGHSSGNGRTRVYQISSGSWNQIGLDISALSFESAGASVSLSADGLTLAVGSPFALGFNGLARIYQYSAGTWSQVGSDINGTVSFGNTGSSVTLSADGSTVAIDTEAANSSTGLVQVYQLISGTWTQVGSDINGEATGDASGRSISLSNDGSILAIGAPNNTSGTGHVRVYENISTVWTQIGTDIDGEAAGDQSGGAVSLSADGSIVAIGARYNNNTGHVRVLKFAGGAWGQIGLDIDGVVSGEYFGTSLGLSNDGKTVVIGANELANGQTGLTRIYQDVSGTWTQDGPDIVAEAAADEAGESVCISGDGLTVAIGAISNDDNGASAGQVRVYSLNSSTGGVNDLDKSIISIYPNPTKELINVNFGNIQGSINYTLTSIEGRIIEHKQNVTDKVVGIDLSKESKGIYLLKVNKNESVSVYRIVRQ